MPLPPLQPAVFPANLREPPPPSLDLFDLDAQFASEKIKLAHLTNKCGEEDLAYYVRECGEVLGIEAGDDRDPKAILAFVLRAITNFRKYDQA